MKKTSILLIVLLFLCSFLLNNFEYADALPADQKKVIDSGADNFNVEFSNICIGAGGGGGGNDGLLSLRFPQFTDEAAIVAGIDRVVADTYSSSPWKGLGQWILDESKKNDVNPLFIVASGGVESRFGDSNHGRNNNNYFGIEKGHRSFPSPQAGILYFIERTNINLSGGPDANQLYKNAKNIYEYSSVHQTGGIFYPGQPFDPMDQDEKPGNREDLWDTGMSVYISWNPDANNRSDVNPQYRGDVYNPLNYYKLNIAFINKITGQSFPDQPGGPSASCSGGGAGANGWDLPGEGDNPMVYYSQRKSGNDPAVQGYYGNDPYGPGPISHCGCGPTSWAMIASTLTGKRITPTEVAGWASTNGFQQPAGGDPCGGSEWWWIDAAQTSEAKWGIKAQEIKIDQATGALRSGALVLVSAGPGPFTSGGHLLVMRAVTEDGKYLFADPNDYNDTRAEAAIFSGQSKSRTALSPEQFMPSVKNLWMITKTGAL